AFYRRFDVAVSGDEHDLRVHLTLAQPRQRRQAVHARQPHVEDDQIDGTSDHPLETFFAGGDGFDRIAFVPEISRERLLNARFAGEEEDRCPSGKGGCWWVNWVPLGMLPPASLSPPCSAMMRRTIASPSPLPRRLVE